MKLPLLATVVLVTAGSQAHAAAPAPVTVVMDRAGMTLEDGTQIPAFGGGTKRWSKVVACVQAHFQPFNVDIVETAPANRPVIRALVGGTPDLIGLEDDTTTGLSPYNGEVIPSSLVYVFSQTLGESDVTGICATAAHEIGHSLGLDHSATCGDVMSYYGNECGTPEFLPSSGPCGEHEERACANGSETQSSFNQIAANVGRRGQAPANPYEVDEDGEIFDPADADVPWSTGSEDEAIETPYDEDDYEATPTEVAPDMDAFVDDDADVESDALDEPAQSNEPDIGRASCGGREQEQVRPRSDRGARGEGRVRGNGGWRERARGNRSRR